MRARSARRSTFPSSCHGISSIIAMGRSGRRPLSASPLRGCVSCWTGRAASSATLAASSRTTATSVAGRPVLVVGSAIPLAPSQPASRPRARSTAAPGVGGVPVGADLGRELGGDRRAADDDLGPQVGRADRLHHGAHVGHRRGEQRGHADEVGVVLPRGVHEPRRRDVDAEVDDLDPAALPHHPDQVLADVVEVALDRADHRAELGRHAGRERGPARGSRSRPSSPGRR